MKGFSVQRIVTAFAGADAVSTTITTLFLFACTQDDGEAKKYTAPGGARTHNPLIRSQMPYPLRYMAR